ncbi:ABC transporter permease subunit [Natrialba asiatica]|uniref:Copper ABC transporter permease n=1 Tax=Natrialba asiatica (strain ATCC 700177 / DSM 12278 / JCM 9576 / FERM P-10747 / NBRC 102637 / 172P1) TaxID=29540 RepID=M0AVJ2_NATA1|nr:ABC transporter permease subunit [Natrialba asiatica]ELZ02545.1 copper ABC transporter permease [Natrialba asiatica DSM 12278]
MSVADVIWKDFLNVRRSKGIWIAGSTYAVFAGLFLLIQRNQLRFYETGREGVIATVSQVNSLGSFFVPIVAFVVAYLAIAGERETGSAKLELGLPNTRRDVLIGKFISRSFVMVLSVVLAYAVVVAILLLTSYPVFPGPTLLALFGLMTLYTIAYVAIAIGISAAVATKARAAAVGFGVYFVLNVLLLFTTLGNLIRRLHVGVFGFSETPILYQFASQFVPNEGILVGIQSITGQSVTGRELPSSTAFYVQPEFMPVVLCVWIVVPLVVGYYRFRRADVS